MSHSEKIAEAESLLEANDVGAAKKIFRALVDDNTKEKSVYLFLSAISAYEKDDKLAESYLKQADSLSDSNTMRAGCPNNCKPWGGGQGIKFGPICRRCN